MSSGPAARTRTALYYRCTCTGQRSLLNKGFVLMYIIVGVYWDSLHVEGNVKKNHDYIFVI